MHVQINSFFLQTDVISHEISQFVRNELITATLSNVTSGRVTYSKHKNKDGRNGYNRNNNTF